MEQCEKLDKAGFEYWLIFLNCVGCVELSRQYAFDSSKIFSHANPTVVGMRDGVLFEGTGLFAQYRRCKFHPLSEKGLKEDLKLFIEHLDFDGKFINHHTISMNLNNVDLVKRKNTSKPAAWN